MNRSDNYMRPTLKPEEPTVAVPQFEQEEKPATTIPKLALADVVRLNEILNNPQADLRFIKSKKGDLRVVVKEVRS